MVFNATVVPDKNDPHPLIIYHGRHCPDGFAAAMAAWLYFEGQATFLDQDHGDTQSVNDLPALEGRAVYVLDFSFSASILHDIEDRAAKLVVLDHHLSAYNDLTGFVFRKGMVYFDMKKSGARLAWEFFHPHTPLPDLIRFVEDRDLWNWQYPQSAGFLASLDMEPFDFARWNTIAGFDQPQLLAYIERGQAMNDKFNHLADTLVKAAQPLVFNGTSGLMVNVPSVFHSRVGDILSGQSGTFALMWTVDKMGVVKCGLRSRHGFDCIALAQSMGGGGHPQACGFKMNVNRLPELLSGVLTAQASVLG